MYRIASMTAVLYVGCASNQNDISERRRPPVDAATASPDSAVKPPDAAVTPTPDAAVTPSPDAAVTSPDAAVTPTPDAAVTPTPDAALPPPPDAAPPPPPDAAPPPPPASGGIAFVTSRDGNDEIYTVAADGTGLKRLTNNAARDDQPAWSPDGTRIAFVSERSGAAEIYVMNADGSNVVRRTFAGGYADHPAWSPDGTKIAYSVVNNGSQDIFVVSPDSGSATLLFSAPGWDGQPAWSPNGAKLAIVSDWAAYDFVYDIYLIKSDGTSTGQTMTTLTGDIFDHVDYLQPSYSPDGTKIATVITQTTGVDQYVTKLGVMSSSGGTVTPLITADTWSRSSWSPDGSKIAFTSVSGSQKNISWVAANGSSSGTIVTNGRSPSWH